MIVHLPHKALFSSIRQVLTFSLILVVLSCKTVQPPKQAVIAAPILLQIGDKSYSPDEFIQSYNKNKMAADSSGQAMSVKEYLALYTQLKLKVQAAQKEGRDTVTAYREEIASYGNILSKNYLADKGLIESMTMETYERSKEEIKVSHILIALDEDASPEDTLAAYKAANILRAKIIAEGNFGEHAARFSDDLSSKNLNGDLGYLSALQMIYPFETAAYNTPIGQISQPVRTSNGYHLIKTIDRRPSRGIIRVAQCLISVPNNASPEAQATAQRNAEEAFAQLRKGESWEKILAKYSDDLQGKQNGGVMAPFGTGKMAQSFEDAAFSLTVPGSYAAPVKTSKGWHIIRLIERKPLESYEKMAPSLRQKVVTDSRGKVIQAMHANVLRKTYTISESADVLSSIINAADSTLITGKWRIPAEFGNTVRNQPLFSINDQTYTAGSFLDYAVLRQTPRKKGAAPKVIMKRLYSDFFNRSLFQYEKAHLEEKDPEFRTLMTEIREGVLLSQMMEKNVWERSLSDSLGQRRLHDANMEKYKYPERAWLTAVSANDTVTLNNVLETMKQSPYPLQRKAEDLLFEPNSAELNATLRVKLLNVVATMLRNPEFVVEVSSYKTPEESDSVSAARLRTVVTYLKNNNIGLTRIVEKNHGSYRASAQAVRNRRVGFQFFSTAKQDIETAFNSPVSKGVSMAEGYFSKGNDFLKGVAWKVGQQKLQRNGKPLWIDIERIEPERVKTFKEARGAVINDYQKFLEKQWLDSLQSQFPVKVDASELEKLIR